MAQQRPSERVTVPVPPAAAAEWLQLCRALEASGPVPCHTDADPSAWWPDGTPSMPRRPTERWRAAGGARPQQRAFPTPWPQMSGSEFGEDLARGAVGDALGRVTGRFRPAVPAPGTDQPTRSLTEASNDLRRGDSGQHSAIVPRG